MKQVIINDTKLRSIINEISDNFFDNLTTPTNDDSHFESFFNSDMSKSNLSSEEYNYDGYIVEDKSTHEVKCVCHTEQEAMKICKRNPTFNYFGFNFY